MHELIAFFHNSDFHSIDINGIYQFNSHLVLVDSDFDFLVDDYVILNK